MSEPTGYSDEDEEVVPPEALDEGDLGTVPGQFVVRLARRHHPALHRLLPHRRGTHRAALQACLRELDALGRDCPDFGLGQRMRPGGVGARDVGFRWRSAVGRA
jgi:hypothetical protein